MAYEFQIPRKVIIGENALELARETVTGFGKKALIVTGKIVAASEMAARLTQCLDDWGIGWTIYAGITGEPTDTMIEEGTECYRKNGCDFGIAIGGGSPLDAAKAILVMSVLPGAISDYAGKEIRGTFPPLAAIPTTAGTGSETTKFTIITDTRRQVKLLLKGRDLLPDLAVIDPSFSVSAPPSVTAATGMDAFTHAAEAYTSRKGNALTDVYALSAVNRIFNWLPVAYREPENKKAREEMAIAAFEAGVCINNASVTLVHGMSRPIGALFHVPHGISNAMLIRACLAYVLDGAPERFARLAVAMGCAGAADPVPEAARKFLTGLEALCRACEIPGVLEYGIGKAEFEAAMEKMAEDAMDSGSPENTIKEVTKQDLLAIYGQLIAG